MGVITKNKTWVDNDLVIYSDINSNFDTVYNEFNGNIDNNNIKAGAGIDATKLANVVTTNTAQSVTGKKTFQSTVATITSDVDGATVTFDMTASNIHKVQLAGNRTLAVSNVATGQAFVVILQQDGTGSRTATWWGSIKWANATTPILSTTASRYDIFSFIYDGTNYYGSVVGQNFG